MKEFELKSGNILKIKQDENPQSPREDDNFGKMICFHSRYRLGDKHSYEDSEAFLCDLAGIDTDDAPTMLLELVKKTHIILPIYLYDHSGITIRTHSFSDRFDSGQIGYIYVSKEDANAADYSEAWINEYYTGKTKEDIALAILEGEVEAYDQFLRGDIYGFEIVKLVTKTWVCKETNEEETETVEEHVDSCWGFYGEDYKTNGMLDHFDDEVIGEVLPF